LDPVAARPIIYLAFGDSITLGKSTHDEANKGGYPGRLENYSNLLNCDPTTCDVVNKGKGGERTAGGVTRIDSVLASGTYDIMLLMEGTNDILKDSPVSNNTIQFNLGVMADKAGQNGIETVHASIIWFHPDAQWGTSRDGLVEGLKDKVVGLANSKSRSFVNAWSLLCPEGNDIHGHHHAACFSLHYTDRVYLPEDPDPVGHPNASGFDMLAQRFYNIITAVPLPDVPNPWWPKGNVYPGPTQIKWGRESPVRATWYHLVLRRGTTPILKTWLPASWVCGASDCTFNLPGALTPGEYNWQVQGRNPAGIGSWSYNAFTTVLLFRNGFESGDTSAWGRGL
jgi:lysophospholipase L1-like esterase